MRYFKVLCCGGRDFTDMIRIHDALQSLRLHLGHAFAVIHGGARGADSLSGEWARLQGMTEIVVPAQWDKFGKSAGSMRNQWMLDYCQPDYAVAFPGGPGTRDMCSRARKAGMQVWRPYP